MPQQSVSCRLLDPPDSSCGGSVNLGRAFRTQHARVFMACSQLLLPPRPSRELLPSLTSFQLLPTCFKSSFFLSPSIPFFHPQTSSTFNHRHPTSILHLLLYLVTRLCSSLHIFPFIRLQPFPCFRWCHIEVQTGSIAVVDQAGLSSFKVGSRHFPLAGWIG